MPEASIFVLFLFVAVGGGLLLYLLVRAEHDQRRPMDRESAEQVARRDLPDDGGRNGGSRDDEIRDDHGRDDVGWGSANWAGEGRDDEGRDSDRETDRFG